MHAIDAGSTGRAAVAGIRDVWKLIRRRREPISRRPPASILAGRSPTFKWPIRSPRALEKRAALLKKAAALDPAQRRVLANLGERREWPPRNFTEAQKAWGGAERAAANDEERERIHQVRLQQDQEQIRSREVRSQTRRRGKRAGSRAREGAERRRHSRRRGSGS